MVIYVDSSTKENCLVIEGHDPQIHAYRRVVTSNVGEYKAVIRALELVLTSGYSEVILRTYSKLVADQLNEVAKVKANHLRPYYLKAKKLLEETGTKIAWISREKNLAGKVLE
jgi:ribonuclease HI